MEERLSMDTFVTDGTGYMGRAVRQAGEAAIAKAGLRATILRPW
jgi:hypothetical protein